MSATKPNTTVERAVTDFTSADLADLDLHGIDFGRLAHPHYDMAA
ncbi:hypothetical protein [Amycolatopsis taiwanensis]|nr:hypothetical protein [Amycolatopsis taiwanensis]